MPLALKAVREGGGVMCAGIHMSVVPSFPYSLMWEERQLLSVANLTRQDRLDFCASRPIGPWTICVRAGWKERRCCCPEVQVGTRVPTNWSYLTKCLRASATS